ncbi:MAG: flavin reductase [Sediminibacterium sp.]|jgi:flavin reductase (DIM6/NTAB) family NADH-FMN oxidoreductase RutF|nr:flavin reductase [Sediminibacterium sp.]
MNTTLDLVQLMEMEQRKRAQFINSISGFRSVALIGTTDTNGQTNLAIFSSIVHIGSNPPLLSFIMRPDSVERHTLTNILETGFYTINHINAGIYEKAHQTSARYPKNVSEFEATGLTPLFKNDFVAPFVAESHIQIGMEFKERLDISINKTSMIIGEIKFVHYPTNCLLDDGFIDIEKAGSITSAGLDSYHTTQVLKRLEYAKP